jgi:hypothetical protein
LVDMIGLRVNYIGGHNNPLAWSIIPKGGEGSITYDNFFADLQDAAILMIRMVRCCDSSDCTFCVNLKQLRENQDVVKFTHSDEFGEEKLWIDSAQCDNHLG